MFEFHVHASLSKYNKKAKVAKEKNIVITKNLERIELGQEQRGFRFLTPGD